MRSRSWVSESRRSSRSSSRPLLHPQQNLTVYHDPQHPYSSSCYFDHTPRNTVFIVPCSTPSLSTITFHHLSCNSSTLRHYCLLDPSLGPTCPQSPVQLAANLPFRLSFRQSRSCQRSPPSHSCLTAALMDLAQTPCPCHSLGVMSIDG